MSSNNHSVLAMVLDDMACNDIHPSKLHHYQLAKIQMMEALALEDKIQSMTERHGALLLMSFALKWWVEVGLLDQIDKGGE